MRLRARWTSGTLLAISSVAAGGTVTFNKDIAPIVFQSCAPCHRPGEAGPFPLLTYRDVRSHAAQIGDVTSRRFMPPWLPDPGFGDFASVMRLTDAQLRLITEWVRNGSPEGNPEDLPPAPRFTEGWQMGPPDMVVQASEAFRVPAGGGDVFRNLVIPVHAGATRYVRGFELRTGNRRVVHHANIWIDRRRTLRARDHEDGLPGFPGMEVPTEARSEYFDPDSHLLFWKPGLVVHPDPAGMSWRLDPETDLIVNLHLQPTGKEESIQPSIGLYFSPETPSIRPMLVQLEHDGAIDIPAGASAFAITDRLQLPVDVDVIAVYPHAHYLGKQIQAWAALPDGSRRELIRISDWDINWQSVYTYSAPVRLPKGTTVSMRIVYDNSAANARNPRSPPARVRSGPRAGDEMGHVWLQVVPTDDSEEDPRFPLQEAVVRRRLEKYPDDFAALCNLGTLLEMRADHSEAAALLRHAVRLQPSSATARNSLGAAYLAAGRADDALSQFREALRLDPSHRNARWNLARLLIKRNDLQSAAAELKALAASDAEDAEARVSLADLLCLERDYAAAAPQYRDALRLRPSDPVLWTNLGGALAMTGDFAAAVEAFEQALRLNPGDRAATEYLSRARAARAGSR